MASLDLVHELGLGGIFFPTALDMSPTLDAGYLRDLRAKADALGLYLESGLGKINPYCSAEAPELRAAGDGDIIAGFTRMIEANAAIGCFELWVSPGNFKPAYRGRLAVDRFRTDVTWERAARGDREGAEEARSSGARERCASQYRDPRRDHLLRDPAADRGGRDRIASARCSTPPTWCSGASTRSGRRSGSRRISARRISRTRSSPGRPAASISSPGPCGTGIVDFAAILPILCRGRPRPDPVAGDRPVDGGQPAPALSAPVHPDRRSGLAGGTSGPDAGGAGGLSRDDRRLRAADRRGRGRELGELREQPLRLSRPTSDQPTDSTRRSPSSPTPSATSRRSAPRRAFRLPARRRRG